MEMKSPLRRRGHIPGPGLVRPAAGVRRNYVCSLSGPGGQHIRHPRHGGFSGTVVPVNLAMVPVKIGDYVLVHAGMAIQIVERRKPGTGFPCLKKSRRPRRNDRKRTGPLPFLLRRAAASPHGGLRHPYVFPVQTGIRQMLSPKITLLSGPGCPVCVTPTAYIDKLVSYAMTDGYKVLAFGDLLSVPGSRMSLAGARDRGGHVDFLYNPEDAFTLAEKTGTPHSSWEPWALKPPPPSGPT